MADRDRPDDDDLEFEFFDEPLTAEAPTRVEPPPRQPRPAAPEATQEAPRPRTPGGGRPIVRLAVLIGGAILLAVALVLGINACRGDGEQAEYADYLESVGAVAAQSAEVGDQLQELLTTTGLTLDELQTSLGGLAEQQAQVVARTEELTPPGSLVEPHESLVDAMELRELGLRGLEQAAGQLEPAAEPAEAGATLAGQARRIVAADVVYADLFKAPTEEVLRAEGVTGVTVPDSEFLSDPEILSGDQLAEVVRVITQGGGDGGTAGGLHGNGIVTVRVGGGQELTTDSETEILVSEGLTFEVDVENSGDFRETDVRVTFRIEQETPIRKQATIDVIEAGETETAVFDSFTGIVFAASTTITVRVQPVDGEQNTANNTAQYPVIFTL